MFGYIRIAKPELKVKEYEMYKAVYCSLCKKLGKSYGFLSRLTLSYDFTFLSLLNMSLKDGCNAFERKRCAFNPFKKCNYCKTEDELDMPAAAAMIMMYYKILDNIADEKGFKKLGFLVIKPIFKSAFKKASTQYPQIGEIVSLYISSQSALEEQNCQSVDAAADPTAKVLSEIFGLCSDSDSQKRVLRRLGYCMGRYIYLLDAACDLEKDKKQGSYNVLKAFENGVEKVKSQLYTAINEAGLAFELLDIKKYKSILGNIIYLGLEDTFKKELEK